MKSPIPAAEFTEQVPILYQNPFGDGKLFLRVPSQGSPFRSETTDEPVDFMVGEAIGVTGDSISEYAALADSSDDSAWFAPR